MQRVKIDSLRIQSLNVTVNEGQSNMNILTEIEQFISSFNEKEEEDFSIDSIRVNFSKQHKLEQLKEVGNWHKISTNDKRIMAKLKKRLTDDEVTTAYQLESQNIYYYNTSTPPKYRTATMVIFGMKQYHKAPPRKELIEKILSILKSASNLDVCIDLNTKPNIEALKQHFDVKQYFTKDGIATDTHYINTPLIPMVEKIVIYDKAYKNGLKDVLTRLEAKVIIPNIRELALPLVELRDVVNIARGQL